MCVHLTVEWIDFDIQKVAHLIMKKINAESEAEVTQVLMRFCSLVTKQVYHFACACDALI